MSYARQSMTFVVVFRYMSGTHTKHTNHSANRFCTHQVNLTNNGKQNKEFTLSQVIAMLKDNDNVLKQN